MKEIKIIDLLNMIAEGKEVPKKIKYMKYNYEAYTYNNDYKDYVSDRGNYGLFETTNATHILNDTVEIIEEDNNKIEKLDIREEKNIKNNWKYVLYGKKHKYNISTPQKIMGDKINELVDIVNNME